MDRPFSQACENNKVPILEVLSEHFSAVNSVLEIGSGTGQHAAFFAEQLPHLQWQPTDQQHYISGIEAWRDFSQLDNLLPPLVLDVNQPWPIETITAIFSANTVHIMSWPEVERLFAGIKAVLASGGVLCLYGPFNYGGEYTSESNARFDQWLKARDPLSGIRDFEAVNGLAQANGLSLLKDYAMPANNRCLVWSRHL